MPDQQLQDLAKKCTGLVNLRECQKSCPVPCYRPICLDYTKSKEPHKDSKKIIPEYFTHTSLEGVY